MIDLHTHSSVSDGTDTIEELVGKAGQAGIEILSISDHDTMDGVDLAQELGAKAGIEVLRGMELSTHHTTGAGSTSIHLLAYGCDPTSEHIITLLRDLTEARESRVPKMVEVLNGLGLELTVEEVEAQSSVASVSGRPHVADAMVARGYVASREEAFATYLSEEGPAYISRYTPCLNEAIELIHQARGVAVLAHPWGRGSQEVLDATEIEKLVGDYHLDGIEVDHVDHDDQARMVLRGLAEDLGLIITGSSDYHGLGKTRNPLGVNTTPYDIYERLKSTIEERGGRP